MPIYVAQFMLLSSNSILSIKLLSGGSRISRRGGRGPRRRGRGLPRWLRFVKFVCQNERIGSLRAGARRVRPPLNPPMLLHVMSFVHADMDRYTCTSTYVYSSMLWSMSAFLFSPMLTRKFG